MIKNKKTTAITAIIVLLLLSSCKSVKDGLSGRKQNNSDEFLIQKKTPLVLPPDFEKMPVPSSETQVEEIEEEKNIKKLITLDSYKKKNKKINNKKIEEFIIDKNKKN